MGASEIEFVIADGPVPGSGSGLAGMAEGFRDLLSGWEVWRPQADEYRELDPERVLVARRLAGARRASVWARPRNARATTDRQRDMKARPVQERSSLDKASVSAGAVRALTGHDQQEPTAAVLHLDEGSFLSHVDPTDAMDEREASASPERRTRRSRLRGKAAPGACAPPSRLALTRARLTGGVIALRREHSLEASAPG
jgi:hypothetical protein